MRPRKSFTINAEIPELGLKKSFQMSVDEDGDIRPESAGCGLIGTAWSFRLTFQFETDRAGMQAFYNGEADDGREGSGEGP